MGSAPSIGRQPLRSRGPPQNGREVLPPSRDLQVRAAELAVRGERPVKPSAPLLRQQPRCFAASVAAGPIFTEQLPDDMFM